MEPFHVFLAVFFCFKTNWQLRQLFSRMLQTPELFCGLRHFHLTLHWIVGELFLQVGVTEESMQQIDQQLSCI